jgi:AraC-like DNA-binding protein
MNINEIKINKSSILDGIEIKSATFIDKAFPLHFHQSWSLAYIEFGNENISFENSNFIVNKNALVLIPPYSLHKNWGNKNNAWTYKALYISNDVILNVSKRINADYSYLASIPYFITYCNNQFEINEKSIFENLENLFLGVLNDDKQSKFKRNNQEPFEDILYYLSQNYKDSITLDTLEKKFKINKYKLLKNFKKKIGLTPLEYQTAIRIENSKQLFYTEIPLVEIALESGFYDQSHFTHSFKKYVGVTPGNYKKNTNILQDL